MYSRMNHKSTQKERFKGFEFGQANGRPRIGEWELPEVNNNDGRNNGSFNTMQENRNVTFYPQVAQPHQSYRNRKKCNDYQSEKNSKNSNANLYQMMGENLFSWTKQPNGEPLVPLESLVEMSGGELACVLLAAHLLKHRQNPNENCMLTHLNCNELRSYVVPNDEAQTLLNRCKQRQNYFNNYIPYQYAPQAREFPMPPAHWLQK